MLYDSGSLFFKWKSFFRQVESGYDEYDYEDIVKFRYGLLQVLRHL
jgi:hypothetical protein